MTVFRDSRVRGDRDARDSSWYPAGRATSFDLRGTTHHVNCAGPRLDDATDLSTNVCAESQSVATDVHQGTAALTNRRGRRRRLRCTTLSTLTCALSSGARNVDNLDLDAWWQSNEDRSAAKPDTTAHQRSVCVYGEGCTPGSRPVSAMKLDATERSRAELMGGRSQSGLRCYMVGAREGLVDGVSRLQPGSIRSKGDSTVGSAAP